MKKSIIEVPTITRTTLKGETYTRKLLAVDVDYPEYLDKIFSHGKSNYTIWFLNKKKKVCCVDNCFKKNDLYILEVTIDAKEKQTKTRMTLDRFLYFVEIGEFVITNKKFNEIYMKPYEQSNYIKRLKTPVKTEISKGKQ